AYGVVLLLSGVTYAVLSQLLIRAHGPQSVLGVALGGRATWKEKTSTAGYASAVALAFVAPWASCALYIVVAVIWLIPDRRIERSLAAHGGPGAEEPRVHPPSH